MCETERAPQRARERDGLCVRDGLREGERVREREMDCVCKRCRAREREREIE